MTTLMPPADVTGVDDDTLLALADSFVEGCESRHLHIGCSQRVTHLVVSKCDDSQVRVCANAARYLRHCMVEEFVRCALCGQFATECWVFIQL